MNKKIIKQGERFDGGSGEMAVDMINQRIHVIRHQKVMLDSDLAELYGVKTKELNQAVSRNKDRFPGDFMFRLIVEEVDNLRSQFVTSSGEGRANLISQFVISSLGDDENLRSQFATSKERHGGRRYLPHAFTEQGVAMLSSVLKSERAIQVNIAIMRAFVNLRRMMATHKKLAARVEEMEKTYNEKFKIVFDVIMTLIEEKKSTLIERDEEDFGFDTR